MNNDIRHFLNFSRFLNASNFFEGLFCSSISRYNIFILMNVLDRSIPSEESLAALFALIGRPARLQILLLIGAGEACVCHMTAALGLRQAYVSQQLMALRRAGLVQTSRSGRNIYYRLADPRLLELIRLAAALTGKPLPALAPPEVAGCPYHPVRRTTPGAEN